MKMRIAFVALLLVAGCGGGSGEQETGDQVLARIGGQDITEADLAAEMEKIPPFQRHELETPEGRAKFLERLIDMEALYLAAADAGMEKDDDVLVELENARRQIMMKHYYKKHIEPGATPSEEQLTSYYSEHQDDFMKKARVKARLIMSGNEEAAKALALRLVQGEDFESLAREESEDSATAADGGDLGWFTSDGYVRGLGVNKDFTAQAFALAAGEVSEPFHIEDKGWALVMVEEKEEASLKTLDEVRGEITRRMGSKLKESHYREQIDMLKDKYGAEIMDSADASSSEDLFKLAQDAKSPAERISYYEQVVTRFGDSDEADRAQFMVGFVYSEELRDTTRALEAFRKFKELYPESDLLKDAEYMVKELTVE